MSQINTQQHVRLERFAKIIAAFLFIFTSIAIYTVCTKIKKERLETVIHPTIVEGISKNLSGLTWNHETKTLFAVTNEPEYLYEISLEGKLLRSVKLSGFKDTEGLAHIQGNIFAIVEEREGLINISYIPNNATEIQHKAYAHVNLGQSSSKNKGFEGVSYDPKTRRISTMREDSQFIRFDIALDELFRPVDVKSIELPDLNVEDVASLDVSSNGHFWILSEASSQILELSSNKEILRKFNLDIDKIEFQPEGMALCPNNIIYIAGEPNILAAYRVLNDN
jgi:uncharacterized protein YjiK